MESGAKYSPEEPWIACACSDTVPKDTRGSMRARPDRERHGIRQKAETLAVKRRRTAPTIESAGEKRMSGNEFMTKGVSENVILIAIKQSVERRLVRDVNWSGCGCALWSKVLL